MPKAGILHDYDLMANREQSSRGVKCAVCDSENTSFQWSDYSGEAMCWNCGCPYQLKWGTEEQVAEGKYPYLSMSDHFVPIAREYWNEAHHFVCYGIMLGSRPGMIGLCEWLKVHHPEELEERQEKE